MTLLFKPIRKIEKHLKNHFSFRSKYCENEIFKSILGLYLLKEQTKNSILLFSSTHNNIILCGGGAVLLSLCSSLYTL